VFDYSLLLHTLTAIEDPRGKYLGLAEKGIQNAMSFVLARHLMHVQVYRHHVRRITDRMLLRGIEYARQDGILPAGLFDVNAADFLECHRQYDDEAVFYRALESQGRSKAIFEALRDRRLFKNAFNLPIDESIDAPRRRRLEKLRDDREGRLGLEHSIAEIVKTDPEWILIDVMRAKNPLSPHVSDENEIMIKMNDGSIKNLVEVLPFQSTRPVTMDILVICPGVCRDAVKEAAQKVISAI
jgi:HD superfamily phosphohydrolase